MNLMTEASAERMGTASQPSAAIGVARPHESAELHVSGEAAYTDDLPEFAGTLHVALGLSRHAHAHIVSLDLETVRAAPGVVAVLTAADIPGENNCGPVLHDDPILAEGTVSYLGQPVFAVIATSRDLARQAAALAKSGDIVRYEPRKRPAIASSTCCLRCISCEAIPRPGLPPHRTG